MKSSGMLQLTGRVVAVALLWTFVFAASTAMAENGETKKVSFEGSVDIVSPYYFRGAKMEDSGLILQPDGAVTFGLTEPMGQVGAVDLQLGLWNSLHSKQTGSTGMNDIWFEADFYTSLSATVAENYVTSIEYVAYNHPNGSISDVEEIGFRVVWDDRGTLGEYAVSPYILWVFEIDNTNSPSTSPLLPAGIPPVAGNMTTHQYIEVGLGKSFVLVASETAPVKVHIPLLIGLSFDGYYLDSDDATTPIGYIDLGALFSMPLPAMSNAGYGKWEVYAGADFFWLGGHYVKDLNGGEWGVAGKAGMKLAF